ncbi:MAG TPA: aspartate-semialdehyde dehydrogenase [Gemmatimonadales bacterium]|nr:aspartate-semialdehyde dehydrogenase [Gemmatimonadales bacterium]
MTARVPVAVLGATGTVGQKFVRLLADHPWFEIAALAASDQSVGRPYGEVVRWRETIALPDRLAGITIARSVPPLQVPARIVFSALDAEVAKDIEQGFARAGALVVTNTRVHRMEPDVPLLIPEINAGHLALVARQRARRGWSGAILANPNCSTAGLVLALAPLQRAFGVEKVFVATMQAVSGAGYPGVPSLDILGNVVPFIGGEEEKMERETCKILGQLNGDVVTQAPIPMSVHTNRVAVVDGHFEVVSVGLGRRATPDEAIAVLQAFRGSERVSALPSSPARPVEVDLRPDRPQSRLDLERGGGMTVTVGRVRPCPVLDLRFALLSHNTIRGAAGAAVQIAELLVAEGLAGD